MAISAGPKSPNFLLSTQPLQKVSIDLHLATVGVSFVCRPMSPPSTTSGLRAEMCKTEIVKREHIIIGTIR